jgi:zinc-binding alcohol dehydrogenase family protein
MAKIMKGVGLNTGAQPGDVSQLSEFDLPVPELQPRDLLVKIVASGMNPVDTKKRQKNMMGESGTLTAPVIMGYDGAGVVEKVGAECSLFKEGDKVFFAGALNRNGTNSEYTAVDERIVGHAPKSLSLTKAAAIPLVLLTAWEGLLEGLGITAHDPKNVGKKLLILPGAGGVGSFVIQLASQVLGLDVIATASRPESAKACEDLGAKYTINHREALKPQLEKLNIDGVDFIYNAYDTSVYFDQYADIVKPFGKIVSIVETDKELPMTKLMFKRVSFTWELMFTRSIFGVEMENQGFILNTGAKMIDSGSLTLPQLNVMSFDVDSLRKAHTEQESGKVIGKTVLTRDPAA